MSNISHSWSVITVWSKLSPGFLCVVLCVFVTLQFCPCFGSSWCILGHELCDFADEIRLLSATFAGLAPFLQNLLQVLHLELFQVHWTQVQLFVCMGWKKKQSNFTNHWRQLIFDVPKAFENYLLHACNKKSFPNLASNFFFKIYCLKQ